MERFTEDANELPLPDIEDFAGTPFYRLLFKIPESLVTQHLIFIERSGFSDQEAVEYLEGIIEGRAEALTETVISDAGLLERIRDQKESILKHLETDVFTDTENFLGSGMTAKVKFFEISDLSTGEMLPLAIKYLLTPTKMTLSASAEHDMLIEVERIQKVEAIEEQAHLNYIKVPHPYFHHQNSKIQCYGMELVDGFDLSKELYNMKSGEEKNQLINILSALDTEVLEEEIETFFNCMHEYCIHGDMKPANIMVSKGGKFYIIDFGQSRLISDIPEKARDQLYTLREDEIRIAKTSIRKLISDAQAIVADK